MGRDEFLVEKLQEALMSGLEKFEWMFLGAVALAFLWAVYMVVQSYTKTRRDESERRKYYAVNCNSDCQKTRKYGKMK